MAVKVDTERVTRERPEVPVPELHVWTLEQFAAVCGVHYTTVKDRLEPDPTDPTRGTIVLWGRVRVPVGKNAQTSAWRVYRRMWERAQDDAYGNRWTKGDSNE